MASPSIGPTVSAGSSSGRAAGRAQSATPKMDSATAYARPHTIRRRGESWVRASRNKRTNPRHCGLQEPRMAATRLKRPPILYAEVYGDEQTRYSGRQLEGIRPGGAGSDFGERCAG